MADFDSPLDTVATLAEVLSFDDKVLSLELGTLCKRCPDVSHEQIFCLLLLKGDLARGRPSSSRLSSWWRVVQLGPCECQVHPLTGELEPGGGAHC